LQLHPVKTAVTKARRGFDFLGTHFRLTAVKKRTSRLQESCTMWPSGKSVDKIEARVKKVIGRRYSLSLKELIVELNPVVQGWVNFHQKHSGYATELIKCNRLNWFLRERIRIFLKRKHSDHGRGEWRVADNRLENSGLARFQWAR
jgi:RNA-directed DNA polymerase